MSWRRSGVLDHGGVLVVEGGAGIGKTALLDAVCERATQAGRQVLRGRGSELEAGFAFGVARQVFERHLAGPAAATCPLWGEASADAAREPQPAEHADHEQVDEADEHERRA